MLMMKVKKLNEDAQLPTRATNGSAGYDLYLSEDIKIYGGRIELCKTGIAIEIPEGYEGQIRCRSSLAKKGLMVANGIGTIDSDYRGEIGVLIYNSPYIGDMAYLTKGERIAQIVFNKVEEAIFEVVDDLCDTDRGEGGFGSTGV